MKRYKLTEVAILTLWVMAFAFLYRTLAIRSGVPGLVKFTGGAL